jgi:hypothetical protein
MHYSDLVLKTTNLPLGRTTVYDLPEGRIEIRNLGVRNPMLSPRTEYRLHLDVDGRELTPRHGDFFSDYLLKVETRPDLHLTLTEVCEQVCNGLGPSGLISSKRLPRRFAEVTDQTAMMQTGMQQTGGLPTEVFLCGLQTIIRVYDLNEWLPNPAEAFRKAFLALEKSERFVDVVATLQPQIMPAKRYFDRVQR